MEKRAVIWLHHIYIDVTCTERNGNLGPETPHAMWKESHLFSTDSMCRKCQESQYINNISFVALRSLELNPKQQRSGLEKMSCTFTAIVCHPASMTDPTEE